jgi:cation transport ATPase, mgtC/sapB family
MDLPLGIFGTLNLNEQINFCLRILIAALCGCLIGYERSRRSKGAGVRTHVVVALSAALMTIVSKYGFFDVLTAGMSADASRVAANIVTGIPFLGAGVILVKQNSSSIQGLTTAAGMWATCGIGMAFGAGLYIIGLFATILLILMQLTLHRILTGYDSSFAGEIIIIAEGDFDAEESVCRAFKAYTVTIQKNRVKRLENEKLEYRISFKTMKEVPANRLAEMLQENPQFVTIEV